MTPALKLVLDTNVVLDWLLFELPGLEPLREAIREGRVTIFTHALISDELSRVLGFPKLQKYVTDSQAVLANYRAQTQPTDLDPALLIEKSALPTGFPTCRDPDDDKFLAFALHCKADALVTKDEELLKLRRKAKPFGFSIYSVEEMLGAVAASR